VTRFRTRRSRVATTTLDEAPWRRVGGILVARRTLTEDELRTVQAEQRRTQLPLDEILVRRRRVSRHEIASLVLFCQLGGADRKRLRTRLAAPAAAAEPSTEVPVGRPRTFKLACVGIDLSMLVLATLAAAWSRSASDLPYPPAGWVALFALLTPALYWSWRLYTYRTTLRPFADAVLIAAATGLASMVALTIQSLAGESGIADTFLPLWALVAVYGVIGRFAFYLFWTAWVVRRSEPAPGHTAVVPLRPSAARASR
jgi:hypothetical protein